MLPSRERLVQLARLSGLDAFAGQFGPPQSAEPGAGALRAFVDEHLETIAVGLVSEAAASDDITDQQSARSYLDDRLTTLGDLLTADQASKLRSLFEEKTARW
jgi:hypothetical protein